MKTALIDVLKKTTRTLVNVEKTHLWYDADNEKMLTLKGGELSFNYDGQELKVSTKPLISFQYKESDNKKDILQWFEEYKDEFKLEQNDIDSVFVSVSFPDESQEDVEASLYQHRFPYEIL